MSADQSPAPTDAGDSGVWDSIVIGAGQAGLSASHHLTRRGVRHLVLDAEAAPGGAWQHRWDALTLADVHGIAELPDADPLPVTSPGAGSGTGAPPAAANRAVPAYFAEYESEQNVPVLRPIKVERVTGRGESLLSIIAGDQRWQSRTLVNATGTWSQPYWPAYPGRERFAGEQLHTHDYPGPEHFRGRRVLVVGGGASAVQFLGALAPITDVVWVTRRPPVWRAEGFDSQAGHDAVALVEERVRRGLPPASVVSVTGLMLRPQEEAARRLGVYDRRLPMFASIEPEGVRWADGSFEAVDVILWATGFRPAITHLAPLHLRSAEGGIRLDRFGTTAVADPRIHMVGYGPSASTIGANRAGRFAARGVVAWLEAHPGLPQSASSASNEARSNSPSGSTS